MEKPKNPEEIKRSEEERIRNLSPEYIEAVDKERARFNELDDYAQLNEIIDEKNAEIEKAAGIDALTKLKNRYAMEKEVPNLLSQMQRNEADCAVLMLDLDDFKKDNDTYGHQAGDSILEKLAMILKSTVRDSDLLYRYGGEEFTIFMPSSNVEDAKELANRIHKILQQFDFYFKGEDGKKYSQKKTVSIGCFSYLQLYKWSNESDFETGKENMIGKADKALYKAKNSGKNTTVIYDESLEK